VAEVRVTQFYANKESFSIEAKYIFPLDSNCAVCDFVAEIEGKRIQAHAKEKKRAAMEYDAAVKRGDGAYLLEAEKEDVFYVSLGNIPPWTRVTLTITYVVELECVSSSSSSIRFVLPTAVAPRYIPPYPPSSNNKSLKSKGVPYFEPWYSCWSLDLYSSVSSVSTSSSSSEEDTNVNNNGKKERRRSSRRTSSNSTEDNDENNNKNKKPKKEDNSHNNDIMQKVNLLQTREVPYALSVYLRLEMPSYIEEITSKTHSVFTVFDGNEDDQRRKAGVMFARENEPLNGDFVLDIRTRDGHQPRALIEEGRQSSESSLTSGSTTSFDVKESVMMVTLVPHFHLNAMSKAEIVFVVDRSGSMSDSIHQAKIALSFFLDELSSNGNNNSSSLYFNIVGFGSNYVMLFADRSRRSTDNVSITKARTHVQSMEANMQGTEILPPLRAVYDLPEIPDHPRQIIVLTDGEVSNTEEVIELVRQNHQERHPDWRLFTMGIGTGVSHSLVRGMARMGKGTVQMVGSDQTLEPYVEAAWRQALQPALTNVTIDWGIGNSMSAASSPSTSSSSSTSANKNKRRSSKAEDTSPHKEDILKRQVTFIVVLVTL